MLPASKIAGSNYVVGAGATSAFAASIASRGRAGARASPKISSWGPSSRMTVYCFTAQTSSLGFGMVWDRKKTASKDQASRTIVSSLVACDNQIVESLALHAIAKTVRMAGFGCKLLVRRSSVHLSRCISYCCSDVPSLDEDWKKFKNKTAFS